METILIILDDGQFKREVFSPNRSIIEYIFSKSHHITHAKMLFGFELLIL